MADDRSCAPSPSFSSSLPEASRLSRIAEQQEAGLHFCAELIPALTEAAFFCITSRVKLPCCLAAALLASCATTTGVVPAPPRELAPSTVRELGRRIWQNECAGSVQGLVSWNAGENFPSLGIGHFIWFPHGVRAPFDESFPAFVAYAKARGVAVPAFFEGAAPWKTRAQFLKEAGSQQAEAMRAWLAEHVDLQTQFIIRRSHLALRRMLDAASDPERVRRNYRALAATPCGMYALIDYVNFKGEGVLPTERYRGRGWGLLQVLETMDEGSGTVACRNFARAAGAVLTERVHNSPPDRGERRWLAGWLNRCRTYAGS